MQNHTTLFSCAAVARNFTQKHHQLTTLVSLGVATGNTGSQFMPQMDTITGFWEMLFFHKWGDFFREIWIVVR